MMPRCHVASLIATEVGGRGASRHNLDSVIAAGLHYLAGSVAGVVLLSFLIWIIVIHARGSDQVM